MNPRISVVVPTYRRLEVERCIAALVAQKLSPDEFEIIVVHDGPSERMRRSVDLWVRKLAANGGPTLRYLALPEHAGPAAARNAGWRAAAADLVAFTDDGTYADPRWLANALRAFADEAVDAGWGRLEMPLGPEPTDYELDAAGVARAPFVTANCFCRKRRLEELGGFDERFALAWREDSDLYFELLEAGARIVHVPSAVVVHPIRRARWGVSISQQRKVLFDALLFKKHPELYRQRIRRTPRWDYYTIDAAFGVCVGALLADALPVALVAGTSWALLTARFCLARLEPATKRAPHVAEMVVTSAVIPPLAVFWRAVGALRFRVPFV